MLIVWSGLICGSALAKQGLDTCLCSTLQSVVSSDSVHTWLFRTWGLVLVDFRPASWRAATALRLAKNAELVVLHGGEPGGVGTWPQDWLKSRCQYRHVSTSSQIFHSRQSSHPTIAGRRVIVDRKSTEWTLMIQGDLDRNGSAFATAVNMLSQNQASPNILLTVAALATQGDILELGTGVFSSPLLHRIAEAGKRGNVPSTLSSLSSSSPFCIPSIGRHGVSRH